MPARGQWCILAGLSPLAPGPPMPRRYVQLDVFASRPGAGNPLAVVLVDAASVGLGGGLGRLPAGRASHQPSARQAMTSSNHTPRMPFSTAVA